MATPFSTPQDAEDAYYDAIDEKNLSAMMAVWDESEETLCLLPMMPIQRGRAAIEEVWSSLLNSDISLEMQIKHLSWIESESIAIHLIEEWVNAGPEAGMQPVYATNIFRKGDQGWHLIMHQNSPTPPPELKA
ncbi:MAG: nuclear transport factor 2 family protein [Candidatus Thiodiazotropha sp. 6PLUC2]